jgi:hypothetical protein
MRPRVLFFIGNLGHGGAQQSLLTILDEAAAVGIDAEVAVWSPPLDHLAHVTDRGVVAHVAPDGTVAARLRWLRRLVIDRDPQIVHSLTHYTNAATSLAALGTDATAIGSVVDGEPGTGGVGDGGLADALARMKLNWDLVLKGQLR